MGHSHAVLVHFQNQKFVLTSMNTHKKWSIFVTEDYITPLKLFFVICGYRWHGWKWIAT